MALRFIPQSITGRMMLVLGGSFVLLLATLLLFEVLEYDSVFDTAKSDFTTRRLARVLPVLDSIPGDEAVNYLRRISHCHDGYQISVAPYADLQSNAQTLFVKSRIAEALSLDVRSIYVGSTAFGADDFSYKDCAVDEMRFPLEGMVLGIQLASGQWLNAEVHQHEWHVTSDMTDWLVRSSAAFLLIGGVALLFVHRLSMPFRRLADAARSFASDFEATELDESGPPDVRRTIRSFNSMQQQITEEMQRRTNTLVAISHDLRSPLTALRVKTELLKSSSERADLIANINKMERITSSALAYLKGESRNEPKRLVDLGALVESECENFAESGFAVSFECQETILYRCRPDALSRAMNNIIDNAIKYAGGAEVSITQTSNGVEICVTDRGPGISPDKFEDVFEPFERLSEARNSDTGGFGLGLAISKAVIEGHDGTLRLKSNIPSGLVVSISLPSS